MENPYAWDTDRLLREFMDACGRAGSSNGGVALDVSAGSDLSRAHYLRNVVLARINRAIPPFNPGDEVRPRRKKTEPLPVPRCYRTDGERKLPELLTVAVVYYLGKREWAVTFVGENWATARKIEDHDGDHPVSWWEPFQFKAEDFEVPMLVKA